MRNRRLIYYSLIGLLLTAFASCSQEDWEQEALGARAESNNSTRTEYIAYTIHVETAGTLGSLVEAGNYSDAQKLTITGNIAYDDVNYVSTNMTTVEVLDLSGATYSTESIPSNFLSSSSKIKEISLPGNITSIGDRAFMQCTNLTSITIPESVTSIGNSAFLICYSLADINLPEGIKSIGERAFESCSSLTRIALPETLTSLGGRAFYQCGLLADINIPKGITNIGDATFSQCSSLTSIILPDGVTNIERYAFEGCNSLTNITIPDGVTNIGEYAFGSCSSLTNITLPDGLTTIGGYAFGGCSSLTNITLPDGLTTIGRYAFGSCSSLTNLIIPDGVTSIGQYAFSGCSSLANISLPESLVSIEDEAFAFCSSLNKVICNSAGDINDLSATSNLYCWLVINRADDKLPMYGPNWKFVAVNGEAESVTLPYRKTVDFTIPEEVKSIKKISYTMTFYANSSSSSYGIWRTIALPFKPTSITHAKEGTLAPFDSGVAGAKNFWLRELTTNGFKDVAQIEANHPYVIAMPYSDEYADSYNISGEVTFSAENLKAEDLGNATPLSAKGTDYTMYASYSYMDKTDGVYVLNSDNQFINSYSSVYPYEAYLKANTATATVVSLNKKHAATRALGQGKRKPQIDDM